MSAPSNSVSSVSRKVRVWELGPYASTLISTLLTFALLSGSGVRLKMNEILTVFVYRKLDYEADAQSLNLNRNKNVTDQNHESSGRSNGDELPCAARRVTFTVGCRSSMRGALTLILFPGIKTVAWTSAGNMWNADRKLLRINPFLKIDIYFDQIIYSLKIFNPLNKMVYSLLV